MATEYHLLTAFGTGQTVTMTIASPCVVSYTSHGLSDGFGVVFTTSGALPTGIVTGTTYYAKSTASGTFNIYDTAAHAIAGGSTGRVITTGSQSGTHTITSDYWYNLPTSSGANYKNRYYFNSAYRVYGSMYAWHVGRASRVNPKTQLTLEIQGKFTDAIFTGYVNGAILGFYSVTITTKVNGKYDSGSYHNGKIGGGYVLATSYATTFSPINVDSTQPNVVIDGIEVNYPTLAAEVTTTLYLATVKNCIFRISSTKGPFLGINAGCTITNNIFYGGLVGFQVPSYGGGIGLLFSNNTLIGNTTGIASGTSTTGVTIINNVVVGNTTNYGSTVPTSSYINNNGGETGDTIWTSSGNANITGILSGDFQSYTLRGTIDSTTDLSPSGSSSGHTSSSKLVDVATQDFSTLSATSISDSLGTGLGNPRPAYKNGSGTSWDIGAFEFDWGYGLIPQTINIVISDITASTTLNIDNGGTPVLGNTSASGTYTYGYSYTGGSQTLTITLRNSGYVRWTTTVTVDGTLSSIPVTATQLVDSVRLGSSTVSVADITIVDNTSVALTNNRYTVQDVYTYLAIYCDDDTKYRTANLMMSAQTHYDFTLINNVTINDTSHQFLKTGSITEAVGNTLWSNAKLITTGLVGTVKIYAYQNGSLVTSFWADNTLDILLKVKSGGSLIDSGFVTFYAREYGYLYAHFKADLSGGGSNPVPLGNAIDGNNSTAIATVAAYSGITLTVGATTWDVGDGAGAQPYTATLNCNNYTLAQVYEYTKWWTRRGSSTVLNSVTGDRYQHLASFADVITAPFGTFAGGKFFLAPGVKLTGMLSADALNFVATDNNLATHTPPTPPVAITAPNLITGTRIQLYNQTTSTIIDNSVVTQPYSFTVTVGGGVVSLGDIIRMRATYTSGATAKNDILNTGVITAAGCSFIDTQTDDTIYNSWAIDGSGVTEFSADADHITVDSNDADGQSLKTRLAAWYKYFCTTATGIQYYFGGMTALAANNIRFNSALVGVHLKNISSLSLVFTDSSVRMWRDDGAPIVSAGTGSIEMDYNGVPDVVTVSTGSGLSTAEHNQLFAIPLSSSGLTTPEHDQLMNTLTVPTFIGLK